ncbi:MAG: class I SAM-dependent methyltransferase [Halieaceae bacterium]|jgi:hypothetical protein|nr:class I SAM-dependent methyltransferase [Halieaceae bacterium]
MLSTDFDASQRVKSASASCRVCGSKGLEPILDYGLMPASDGFISPAQLAHDTQCYPLTLVLCQQCTLLQLLDSVPSTELFGTDYVYLSSASSSWVAHAKQLVHVLIEELSLDHRSRVIELASNDGYLLQHFVARGVPVLGIEPAPVPATVAQERGIPTRQTFFSHAEAENLLQCGPADLIVANNVLAHVTDINDVVSGIARLLAPNGMLVFEVPWVGSLLGNTAFDTVYHEHLCYFSVRSLLTLFDKYGLHIIQIEQLATHGGSIRCRVTRENAPDDSVAEMLRLEREQQLNTLDPFQQFADRACRHAKAIASHLSERRRQRQRVASYGAAAKGTILLTTLGDEAKHLMYVADINVKKQGRYVPGLKLPIVPPRQLLADQPDAVLLLPWNLASEITEQLAPYLQAGGELIIPLPELKVLRG